MDLHEAIVVVGGANMDIQGYSAKPLRGHDSNPGRVEMNPGGVGRNIAENLARLALPVHFLSATGNDDAGRAVIRHSTDAGVDCSAVRVVDGARTATYLAMIDADGDMSVALIDAAVHAVIDCEYVEQHVAVFEAARVVVVDTNLETEVLSRVCEVAGGVPVFVDPVSVAKATRIRSLLPDVHTIKANRLEAEALTGISCRDEDSCLRAAVRLRDLGVENAVITGGAEGIAYADASGCSYVYPNRCRVVSASGAGDAFTAGLIYGFVRGHDLSSAVDYGRVMSCWAVSGGPTIAKDISASRLEKEAGKT